MLVRLAREARHPRRFSSGAASPTSSSPARTSRSSRRVAPEDGAHGGRARAVALRAARQPARIRRSRRSTARASAAARSSRSPATTALMSDSPKAQIGLPEVRLGIFPAWGGCTRLPRVVGLAAGARPDPDGQVARRPARRRRSASWTRPCRRRSSRTGRLPLRARRSSGRGKPRARRRPTSPRRARARGNAARTQASSSRRRARACSRQTGGHYPAPLEALEVIEEGYGSRSPTASRSRPATSGSSSAATVQKNLLGIFFLTEEVKKETGVADPSVRPRGGRRGSACSARA